MCVCVFVVLVFVYLVTLCVLDFSATTISVAFSVLFFNFDCYSVSYVNFFFCSVVIFSILYVCVCL